MSLLLRFVLLPFSWLYAAVMAVRNWLYDKGYKSSASFSVPLLAVGNLRVGGTGKTPHVTWLVRELLRQGHRPAILSRGYGRQTTGPRLTSAADSAATVGDEPWQYFQEFGPAKVPVAVAEKRRLGIGLLLRRHPETTIVVLDDAYQHRAVRPTLNLLLTDFAQPFYHDHVLPVGRLRERRAGARRADVVIMTKCPADLSDTAQASIIAEVQRYASPGVPVLFSAFDYGRPQPLVITGDTSTAVLMPGPALLLTGIAQPQPLEEYIENQGFSIRHHEKLPDHHAFQRADLDALQDHWQAGWPIFTTEKDATRLQAPALWVGRPFLQLSTYTIPVRVAFLGHGAARMRQLLPALPVLSPAP